MDEPTAALSDRETERLFAMIRQLQAEGVAIVYISHRMAEVFAMGDRITVLRDGKKISSLLPGEATPDELVHLMVGRNVDRSYARNFCQTEGAIILEVKDLHSANGVNGVSLMVRSGEIVGLSGLVGAGRTEVARAIFGADKVTAGTIFLHGKKHSGGPDKAVSAGIALVPESRKAEGLALIRSICDNLMLPSLPLTFPNRIYKAARARQIASELIQRLRISTPSSQRPVRLLSGGNQQKVVIGKWLGSESRLFIIDEPTRGIDVGAKAEVFALIDLLVQQGAGVLMISSELSEVVQICDRSYVMRDGRIAGHLSREQLTEANILKMGVHDE